MAQYIGNSLDTIFLQTKRQAYTYVATAGQTIFSGADSYGNTFASIERGQVLVYENGVLLEPQSYTVYADRVEYNSGGAALGAEVVVFTEVESALVNSYTRAETEAAISDAVLNGVSNVSLDDLTDVDLTTAPTDGQALIWDNASGQFIPGDSFSQTDFDSAFAAKSADDLTEGSTNLYYTDARVGAYLEAYSFADKSYVDTAVSNLIDTAPTTLDTLNELAAALDDDPNFATTITTSIGTKLATADFNSTADTWLGTKTTDELSEGSTNLYYTSARVITDVDNILTTKTTTDLAEGTNLYYTDARVDSNFALKTTTDLAEGSNLYFTAARVSDYLTTNAYATETFVGTAISTASSNYATAAQGALADSALQSVAFADLTSTPTTLAGYGITDAPAVLTDLGIVDGTIGQILTTDGAGGFTFEDAAEPLVVSGTAPSSPEEGALWFDNVTTGQLYAYVGTSWLSTAGLTTLNFSSVGDLSDVDITTSAPTAGQALIWDAVNSKFIPGESFSQSDFNTAFAANSTDDLSEGATNLYYTDARADARIALASSNYATAAQGALADTALQAADLNGYATETYVGTAISNLIDTAPTTLDTLNELAAALGDDPNFATTVTNSIGLKANTADLGTAAYEDVGYFATAAQGALADSALQSVAFADLTSTPTTISGYGITDAFDGAYSSLTGTPTTLAGYGITDAPASLTDLGITDGTIGQILTTDGAGGFTFEDAAEPLVVSGTAPASPEEGALWFDNVTTGQLYAYVGTSWVSTAGLTTLNFSSVGDLSDVDITSVAPTDGQALVWDNATSTFIPGDVAVDFSGYATETYVNTAISTASSNYATAAQGALADTALQASDLTGYATETFVNNAVAAKDNTDEITEGSTNLYYTDARVETKIDAYVTGGTGVTVTSGEIAIGQDVSTTANVTFADITSTGSVQIDGDLTVSGTTVTINATNLAIEDNMIYLNEGSAVANPDLGIAGNYNDGTYAHAGVFRDATDGVWKFYDGYTPEPDASAYIDTTHASFNLASVQASSFIGNITGTVSSLSNHTTTDLSEGTNLYYTDARVGTYLTTNSYATETFVGSAITTASSNYATAAQGALADTALQSVAFADLTSTPTTLSGYGITDAPSILTDLSITDGTIGQVLTTDGAGGFTFEDAAGGATVSGTAPASPSEGDLWFDNTNSGQLYTYVGTTWLSTAGLSTLEFSSVGDLSDVDLATNAPTDGQALVWDNASSTFIPGDVAVDFTGYATETYVTSAISTASTNYATVAQGALADTALQAADLTGYATETYVNTAVSDLVASAPAALDTLNELAAALGNDENFATTITNSIALKANSADIPSVLTDLSIVDGTIGQVLTTDGAGGFTFEDAAIGGAVVSGTAPVDPEQGALWFDNTNSGQLYTYVGTTWLSTAGLSTLEFSSVGDLSDVDLVSNAPTSGQALIWDDINSKFVPGDVAVDLTGYATETFVNTAISTASSNYATAAQGALADTALQSVAFADLTTTPTTLAGYGITDAFDGAYSSLTGAPTIPSVLTDLSIVDGTIGQVLTTDGAGGFTFADAAGGASVVVSGTAPETAEEGDLWFDNVTTGELHVYENGAWLSTAVPVTIESINELGDVDITTTAPTSGQALIWDDVNSKFVPGDSFSQSDFNNALGTISADIIPATDVTYDLGSATNRFKDLYLSGNSIYLGEGLVLSNDGGAFVISDGASTPLPISLSNNTTSDLAEGTNLYYTDERVGTYLTTNSYATETFVNTAVSDLVASAPAALDTLNELAAALGNDENFATTITNSIALKANIADIPSALTDLGITDGTIGQILTTDGSGSFTFTDAASGVTVSGTAPSSPSDGDLWFDDTTTGQLYVYENGSWTSSAIPPSINSIADLSDVDIITTAPTDGQALVWDNANSKFVPGDVSVDLTGYATETFVGTAISTASSNYATAAQGALADSALQSVAFSDLGIADGTVGQVLTTDGAGGFTFADASGGGGASITTSETAPVSPSEGDMWFNSATLALYLYYNDGDSTQWIQVNDAGGAAGNGLVIVSSAPPVNPAIGDLWYDDASTGSLLIYNGSVWVSTADGGAGGQSTYWVETSTTYDAAAGSKLFVDTSSNAVQVNLPASPIMGDEVYIVDAAGNSGSYNITINRNGNKITGLDENFTIDVDGAAIILAYYNVTRGWIVISK